MRTMELDWMYRRAENWKLETKVNNKNHNWRLDIRPSRRNVSRLARHDSAEIRRDSTRLRAEPEYIDYLSADGFLCGYAGKFSRRSYVTNFFVSPPEGACEFFTYCWDISNSLYQPDTTFSDDNRTFTTSAGATGNTVFLAERGFSEGTHYWEVVVHQMKISDMLVGITVGCELVQQLRGSATAIPWVSVSYNQTGAIYCGPLSRGPSEYHAKFETGSVLGFRLDADQREMAVYCNGEPQVVVTHLPPLGPGQLYYPAASVYFPGDSLEIRTGDCPPPPPGSLSRIAY
ncbi:hypothetical protein PAPYR_8537 [Paratrimastix pyriformis]|uniref:B30.2/SPRY domain-containing protein n=1 Tax=Paratrimastix pyriformis TaxID=342808 RepID=A0ABQ8UAF6_9EUKA|nr:hypothetical protein PAPYR_8537 [Paratrimastix pyriformis]